MRLLSTSVVTGISKRKNVISLAGIDLLEDRRLLSITGTLSPIAGFDGTNGENPVALVADSEGNLFGITTLSTDSSQAGSGVVFEIPVNTSTIQAIASLGNDSGTTQGDSLIIDSAGDLFGTTERSLTNGGSTIFEIPHGSTTLQTLATFTVPASPIVNVIDSAGDLYGIGNDDQSLFEIAAGSGTITDLSGAFGENPAPLIDLEMGSDGNLYGLTGSGVVAYSPATHTASTLATFDTSVFGTSALLPTGIALDSNNDVFGLNDYGGPTTDGDAWVLPYNTGNISLIASFSSATGVNPVSKPTLDTTGDLLGLTSSGGASGDGTVFEIANVTGTGTDAVYTSPLARIAAADVTASATPSVVTNLGSSEQVPSQGGEGVTLSPAQKLTLIWGALFGDPFGGTPEGDGEILKFIPNGFTSPPTNSIPDPASQQAELKELQDAFANETSQTKSAPSTAAVQAGMLSDLSITLKEDELQTVDASSLSVQIAEIKTMLAQTNKSLKTAATSVNKQLPLVAKYNGDGTTVSKLQTQLAALTKASAEAALQKKITAEQSAQAKVLSQDTAINTTAGAELTTISTLETNIQTALDALPAPTISFTGNIASLSAAVQPGKKITAVVALMNQGNVTATGSMEIGIAIRPAGTDGGSDISLSPFKLSTHLKPGASTNAHLSVVIPSTLAAGTYTLVVQLDSTNVFKESTLPSPIISVQSFTVS